MLLSPAKLGIQREWTCNLGISPPQNSLIRIFGVALVGAQLVGHNRGALQAGMQ